MGLSALLSKSKFCKIIWGKRDKGEAEVPWVFGIWRPPGDRGRCPTSSGQAVMAHGPQLAPDSAGTTSDLSRPKGKERRACALAHTSGRGHVTHTHTRNHTTTCTELSLHTDAAAPCSENYVVTAAVGRSPLPHEGGQQSPLPQEDS